MPKVKNLQIQKKQGTENTYFATWKFDGGDIVTDTSQLPNAPSGSGSNDNFKAGDWVKVKQGAKWYNGATISSFVFDDEWQIDSITGDRAVLGRNVLNTKLINSPIALRYLEKTNRPAPTSLKAAATPVAASSNSGISLLANFAVGSYVRIPFEATIWEQKNNVWYQVGTAAEDLSYPIYQIVQFWPTFNDVDLVLLKGASEGYTDWQYTTETKYLQASDPPDENVFTVDTWVWVPEGAWWVTSSGTDERKVSWQEASHAWRIIEVLGDIVKVRDAEPGYWDQNITHYIYSRMLTRIVTDVSVGDTISIKEGAVWADGTEISNRDKSVLWVVQSVSGYELTVKDITADWQHVIMSWDVQVEGSESLEGFGIDTWVWINEGAVWYPANIAVNDTERSHSWRIIGIINGSVVRVRDSESGYWDQNITNMVEVKYLTRIETHIDVGDVVKIKPGACWASSGDMVADSVINDYTWKVTAISGYELTLKDMKSDATSIIMSWDVEVITPAEEAIESERYDTLSHYELMWAHYTGQGMWFHDSDATTYAIEGAYDGSATYTPPEEAVRFRVQVRPVAKTHKVNDQDVAYWIGEWTMATYDNVDYYSPDPPEAPTLKLDGLTLTVSLDNITDPNAELVKFEIYDGTTLYKTSGTIKVEAAMASFQCSVNAGGQYRARAKAAGWFWDGIVQVWSEWGPFSGTSETIPTRPTAITEIRAASPTSVYLAWDGVSTADTYDIEYATNPVYLEGSNATTTINSIETTQYTVTGLEGGDEYYFRVRAVNDQGHSDWTDIKSVIIGATPAAPTTWSSATTVIVGDPLNLYWVHNARDNSWETYAQLELWINDVKQDTITIESDQEDDPDDENDVEKTHSYAFDTSKYAEGTTLKWRVRTAGITHNYGDWSIQRQVDIYARPTLSLSVTDYKGEIFETLTQFPFHIYAFAGPNTQEPIGYHVLITALTSYETVDRIGEPMIVSAGDTVYSKYFDTNEPLNVDISAMDVDFAPGQMYNINVKVSMNSGLTAESDREFDVSWTDEQYEPSTEIGVDMDTFIAYLKPFCRNEDGTTVENITLAVYRRNFDGSFTEIASGIDPFANTLIADPHPSLDYARYRVVATSTITGAVSYYDPPGYPIKAVPAVIQWDEQWKQLDTDAPYEAEDPVWEGSMIKFPWNIDVSENSVPDVTLVNYIGRTYPVSYYGTAIDSTATWNMDIDKTDAETIYALRRLQVWAGDVYVREPTGAGYWANVSVSFTQNHDELIIPVTLEITRVEGGM